MSEIYAQNPGRAISRYSYGKLFTAAYQSTSTMNIRLVLPAQLAAEVKACVRLLMEVVLDRYRLVLPAQLAAEVEACVRLSMEMVLDRAKVVV